jgi:glycosyltransferase involved in cell wall biosynthesis
MILTNKAILLISPEAWGDNFVSKHHYALELAKRDNRVYFLNPPASHNSVERHAVNLFLLNYKPRFRGLARMPSFISAWLIQKEVQRLEKLCKQHFDIIWNFDSSRFFNLRNLPDKLCISHRVDLSEDKNIKLLNSTADIALASTQFILHQQRQFTEKAYYIGHGVALPADLPAVNLPDEKKHPKVGYLGNLLIKYLDWQVIFNLVHNHPEVPFYFAGPYEASNLAKNSQPPAWLTKVREAPNTHFIGVLTQREIHAFLAKMDILLLAYQADKYKDQLANPHKLLEYLASGRVVLANWTEEYKDKQDLLEMVKDNNQLPARFKKVIDNLSYYNRPEKQQARRTWVLANTYEKQIERIEKIIQESNVDYG